MSTKSKIENLESLELDELIISVSSYLLSQDGHLSNVPDVVIERICDLADYELVIRSESPLH